MEGFFKDRVNITHGHGQQCGDGHREGGTGTGRRGSKREIMGTSAISVNNKNEEKNNSKESCQLEVTGKWWSHSKEGQYGEQEIGLVDF